MKVGDDRLLMGRREREVCDAACEPGVRGVRGVMGVRGVGGTVNALGSRWKKAGLPRRWWWGCCWRVRGWTIEGGDAARGGCDWGRRKCED